MKNLMFNPDREIGVEWADSRRSQFHVVLEIIMEDRQGILARVISTISNLKTNIRQMETRTGDGKATVEMVLEIADLKHLEKVSRSLSSVDARDPRRPQVQHPPRHSVAMERRERRLPAGTISRGAVAQSTPFN